MRRTPEKVGNEIGIRATPQLMRRTTASFLHQSGARIEVVSAFLGHSQQVQGSQVALQHYVKISLDEMRRMLDAVVL